MKEVFITGGTGFIGSHLIESILKNKIRIIAIDDNSNSSPKNLEPYRDEIEIIKFDISNPDWSILEKYNPDTIFHLATHPRSFSFADPIRNAKVNVLGTLNLFEFAKNKKSKVVYTSNSGICGDPKFLPVTEEHPIDCKTPYDANKLIGEYYAKIYYQIHGVYSVVFRLATVYGERQRVNKDLGWMPLIPSLVERIEKGERPIIQWDGEQTRDLIYVKDVVDCLLKGANSNDHGGEMFLVSTNTETSVNKTLELICKITGKNVTPKYEKKKEGDLRRMVLSYGKAKKLLGYSPQYTLEEGIRRYVKWYEFQELVD